MKQPSSDPALAVIDYDADAATEIENHQISHDHWPEDRGATTAEYAVVTLAAVGFAGLLILLLRSDGARGLLWDIISGALTL